MRLTRFLERVIAIWQNYIYGSPTDYIDQLPPMTSVKEGATITLIGRSGAEYTMEIKEVSNLDFSRLTTVDTDGQINYEIIYMINGSVSHNQRQLSQNCTLALYPFRQLGVLHC